MGKNKLKWLTLSQSGVFLHSGLIFPFYILFVKTSAQATHSSVFLRIVRAERGAHLSSCSDGCLKGSTAAIFCLRTLGAWLSLLLYVPHIGSVVQVYIVQVLLGLFGAMQKHGEKVLIADFTDNGERGKKIEITTFGLRSFQRQYYARRLSRRLFTVQMIFMQALFFIS